jgi:polysaccharide pyruvyl transferase WcaK-like protein
MEKILLFNPAISSINLGDEIISQSSKKYIYQIFKSRSFYVDIPTHTPISNNYLNYFKDSKLRFVLGTNLLQGKMNGSFRQWDITIKNIKSLKPVILLGVGWWQYKNDINYYTKTFWRSILSKDYLHSVRDEYTKQKLNSIGINNVINTGCPTMWNLTNNHCQIIPTVKSDSVIFTLTDYDKDTTNDKKLINNCLKFYKKIYFWPQGYNDLNYLHDLGFDESLIRIIEPNLKAYDDLLESNDNVDYIGTRLHAGIRALQFKRRTIIIGIDNRSLEKKKDFNLVVLNREKIDELENMINQNWTTNIKLHENDINIWLSQFNKLSKNE